MRKFFFFLPNLVPRRMPSSSTPLLPNHQIRSSVFYSGISQERNWRLPQGTALYCDKPAAWKPGAKSTEFSEGWDSEQQRRSTKKWSIYEQPVAHRTNGLAQVFSISKVQKKGFENSCLDITANSPTRAMANEAPKAEMRKQQGFFLYSHFMFHPLLWPSQLQTEPLRTQKAQDPRPQDIKTFLCTDCLLTITSLSQLSVNRTNQSLAWERLIRDAHPQIHSLPGTTQGMAALIQQQAPQSQSDSPCPVSPLQRMGHMKTFPLALYHTTGAAAPSVPYQTTTRMKIIA